MQSSAPAGAQSTWDSALGAIEDNISQCPFLQMTYTAENPHADGSAAPGARPRYRPPRHRDLHATSRTHDNWMAARQTSCRQQTAPPQPRCSKDVNAHPHRPGARPGRPCRKVSKVSNKSVKWIASKTFCFIYSSGDKVPPSPRTQLRTRSCSNKHTHKGVYCCAPFLLSDSLGHKDSSALGKERCARIHSVKNVMLWSCVAS